MFAELSRRINLLSPGIISENMSFIEFLEALKKKFSMVEIEMFVISWWFIWYNRNGVIFQQEACNKD